MNFENPHRRFNPLTGEWILVSPHRTKRPWQGKQELSKVLSKVENDENCYLCPGNERAGGKVNPIYKNTFVFTNDFSALLPDTIEGSESNSLFTTESVKGICKVICFSPNHSLTLPQMDLSDIEKVINIWSDETEELGKTYNWVQVFENKGDIMGCSNPHPHGQIWASSSIPNEPYKENEMQKKYFQENYQPLLLDYLEKERELSKRVVAENDNWIVIVPFWATWPFETILIPKKHRLRMNDLKDYERKDLAVILKGFLSKYDKLFDVSFPYTMGWHGAPFNEGNNEHWQLHAHFYPPLLRSATVKKFMVGYEMLAEAQRDITPEQAVKILKDTS